MPSRPEALANRRDLAPVYLVAGDEPLQLTETVDLLHRRAREAGYAEREVLDATPKDFDWRELAAAGASLSLFAERRIIDLRLGNGSIASMSVRSVVPRHVHLGSPNRVGNLCHDLSRISSPHHQRSAQLSIEAAQHLPHHRTSALTSPIERRVDDEKRKHRTLCAGPLECGVVDEPKISTKPQH